MKQILISNAYDSLTRISRLSLPVHKAYQVYKLMKAIEEPYNFGIEQKKKALQHFHGELQLNGSASFANEQDYLNCMDEFSKIDDLDIEITVEPVRISSKELNGQSLTPIDIFNLEEFVVFEEVE